VRGASSAAQLEQWVLRALGRGGLGTESKVRRGCVTEASDRLNWASLQVLYRRLAVKPLNYIGYYIYHQF
jgi:hypothetical protein